MMDLARSPHILQHITPLIGPDIQLQHSKLATKPVTKGTDVLHWHQDFAFFPGYRFGDAWIQDGELARKRDYFAE
jgi:hypothetical protein